MKEIIDLKTSGYITRFLELEYFRFSSKVNFASKVIVYSFY